MYFLSPLKRGLGGEKLHFEYLNFGFVWDLVLGIWDLS